MNLPAHVFQKCLAAASLRHPMGSDAWTGAMRQEAAVLGYVQMDHRDAGTWVQTNNEILKVLAIVSSETEP